MKNVFFYFKFLCYALWDYLHKAKCEVKLAVVGSTAAGKTYFLIDFIESLKRLGYKHNESYNSRLLHPDANDLLNKNREDGTVEKSSVVSCRLENLYVSRFIDSHDKSVKFQFLDIPGEVMVSDSIIMFRAVMKAMMACRSKIFTVSLWGNPETGKIAKVVRQKMRKASEDNPISDIEGLWDSATYDNAIDGYTSADARESKYQQDGFILLHRRKVSGATLFKNFLDYDTDSAINAIIKAWDAMKVDKLLPEDMLQTSKGDSLFSQTYKNHFFYHYFIFHATDVVICDKCCTPKGAGSISSKDTFPTMMQALKAMTDFSDLPKKSWYLALKGMDALMKEEEFKKLFELSDRDINLVYSHFTVLLRQACKHGFIGGGSVPVGYKSPFSSSEKMMTWLTGDKALHVRVALVEELERHYDPSYAGVPFKSPSDYDISVSSDLITYMKDRLNDFLLVDNRLLNLGNPKFINHRTLLDDMPQHVFFISTPIDKDFHICSHDTQNPKAFAGAARHYSRRACFGTLQLAASMMGSKEMKVKENKRGWVLDYVYGQNF